MMELKRGEKDENYADAVVLGIIFSEFGWVLLQFCTSFRRFR